MYAKKHLKGKPEPGVAGGIVEEGNADRRVPYVMLFNPATGKG